MREVFCIDGPKEGETLAVSDSHLSFQCYKQIKQPGGIWEGAFNAPSLTSADMFKRVEYRLHKKTFLLWDNPVERAYAFAYFASCGETDANDWTGPCGPVQSEIVRKEKPSILEDFKGWYEYVAFSLEVHQDPWIRMLLSDYRRDLTFAEERTGHAFRDRRPHEQSQIRSHRIKP